MAASKELLKKLYKLKTHKRQSHEDVVWDLINGHNRPYVKKKKKGKK